GVARSATGRRPFRLGRATAARRGASICPGWRCRATSRPGIATATAYSRPSYRCATRSGGPAEMKAFAQSPFTRHPRARERGAALLIALVILVALTMAGIAMMRSVDTATLVAGNIGFRQATINAADQGIQGAYNYIYPRMAALSGQKTDDAANGFTGITPLGEAPDWYLSSSNAGWANAVSCNGTTPATACTSFGPGGSAVDSAGNNVTYVIHRLCDASGTVCGQTQANPSTATGGVDMSSPNFFVPPPSQHYRVTVRVNGPRNSVAYVQ